MDSRPSVIRIVESDIQRALRHLRAKPAPQGTTRAWLRIQVSPEMWELFYPPLSFINEDDVINIVVVWDMKADKLVFWCVIDEREVNDIVIQRTTAATEPFGMALAPSEMNAPLDLLFE